MRVKITLAVTRPLSNLIEEANAVPAASGNQAPRRLRRLAGRALSTPFIRTRITRSFTWAHGEDARRQAEREEQERGPNQARFTELVALHEENLEMAEERRRNRPARRSPAFLVTFFFVSINYASQWLFWAGYVETAGER